MKNLRALLAGAFFILTTTMGSAGWLGTPYDPNAPIEQSEEAIRPPAPIHNQQTPTPRAKPRVHVKPLAAPVAPQIITVPAVCPEPETKTVTKTVVVKEDHTWELLWDWGWKIAAILLALVILTYGGVNFYRGFRSEQQKVNA